MASDDIVSDGDNADTLLSASTSTSTMTRNADLYQMRLPTGDRASRLDVLAAATHRWSSQAGDPVTIHWPDELTVRAAQWATPGERSHQLADGARARVSANGSCRLLRAADQWIAINLPRTSDVQAVGALIEGFRPGTEPQTDPWAPVERWVSSIPASVAVNRARLLGMAAATLGDPGAPVPAPYRRVQRWATLAKRSIEVLRIVDLSSLWAGPLAALLLQRAGAQVTKVESTARPDGARAVRTFYNYLHPAGQPTISVDLGTEEGRTRLRHMLNHADVVIEASRPRALQHLHLAPDDIAPRSGRVWLSITGYGRREPGASWVAFGDDAAVAGGLVSGATHGGPGFCADAVADPISGMIGATAILRSLARGGGELIDLSMAGCAASIAGPERPWEQ